MARSRPRWLIGALGALLVATLAFMGLAVVLGPGKAIYWAGNLVPVVVVVVVVVGAVVLLAREGGKVLDSRDQPPSTSATGAAPREEGFSRAVYGLLLSLLLLASMATTYFFWLVIRDQWFHERLLVAGRFDQGIRARSRGSSLCCWLWWRCRRGCCGGTTRKSTLTVRRYSHSSCWCSR